MRFPSPTANPSATALSTRPPRGEDPPPGFGLACQVEHGVHLTVAEDVDSDADKRVVRHRINKQVRLAWSASCRDAPHRIALRLTGHGGAIWHLGIEEHLTL